MTLKRFEVCTQNFHITTKKKRPNKKMWRKQIEETMCMVTQVFSFSLSDGDGTFHAVMKLATSNKSKWKITTTCHCFRKCGDDKCVPCNASNDGSTPCIAWVASYASLRSKYGELFYLNPFFFQKHFCQPFFGILANFCHKKTLV
jgi:aspartate carbamoyltransferase regulatory subunit